jgi:hypothetical protein
VAEGIWQEIAIYLLRGTVAEKHPYPNWENELDKSIFRHISFTPRVSPFTCNMVNLGSEYAMPELIEYSFNKNNFRSIEFRENAELVVLGCSHTLGVGVPQNLIWPSFAKDLLGFKNVVNLGTPGCSIAKQVRILSTYIRSYGAPKMILCNFPELRRYEHIKENGQIVYGSTYGGMQDNSYTIKQAVTQSAIALNALEAICKAGNILLRWQVWADEKEFYNKKLSENFSYFVPNKYTVNYLQLNKPKIDEKTGEVEGVYAHSDWPDNCCSELKSRSNGCFNYGYDRYSVPKKYQQHGLIIDKTELEKLKKETLKVEDDRVIAHFGSHAHWHWAKNLVDSL